MPGRLRVLECHDPAHGVRGQQPTHEPPARLSDGHPLRSRKQHFAQIVYEVASRRLHDQQHFGCGPFRQDKGAEEQRAADPERDLAHARDRDIEDLRRGAAGPDADDRRRKSGQYPAVSDVVAKRARTEGTKRQPQREADEKGCRRLCKEANQNQTCGRTHERRHDPRQPLGRHMTRLRRHGDKHREQRPLRLVEAEPECQEYRCHPGKGRLGAEERDAPGDDSGVIAPILGSGRRSDRESGSTQGQTLPACHRRKHLDACRLRRHLKSGPLAQYRPDPQPWSGFPGWHRYGRARISGATTIMGSGCAGSTGRPKSIGAADSTA